MTVACWPAGLEDQIRSEIERLDRNQKRLQSIGDRIKALSPPTYLDYPAICNGRLTLTSATPVTTTDVTNAGTLYFTPFRGAMVALYNGTRWELFRFTEISLALSVTSGTNYDVFLYESSGAVAMELTAWSGNTTRATALALQDGIYVKSGTTTRRYVGTIRGSASNKTEDSQAKRFVWNYYNRVPRDLYRTDATVSWTYTTFAWRAGNNSSSNIVEVVVGVQETWISLRIAQNISGTTGGYVGICEDCSNTYASYGDSIYGLSSMNGTVRIVAYLDKSPVPGYHYYQWTELGLGSGSCTRYSSGQNTAFFGYIEA